MGPQQSASARHQHHARSDHREGGQQNVGKQPESALTQLALRIATVVGSPISTHGHMVGNTCSRFAQVMSIVTKAFVPPTRPDSAADLSECLPSPGLALPTRDGYLELG